MTKQRKDKNIQKDPSNFISYAYKSVAYGKQMQIRWRLESPMPASVYEYAKYKSAI
ncbi:MAG: hypothetical protein I3J02_01175 [Prevotella sp.]|nr:hypothetical protein [Prevotella sp.]